MTRHLNPYPAYQDSGVPWLGPVPEHWEVQRLKNSARLIMGQSPSSDDCSPERIGVPFLQGCAEFGVKHPKPKQFCRAPAKESPRGAILMSVRAPVGRLNVADQNYGIGRGLCAIVPYDSVFLVGFVCYALEASAHGLAVTSTGSTYDAVSVGDVGSQPSLLPPLPEQAAIVRFLDQVDRRIRRYIRAKQKLVKLLEEQKQAVIHRAVTRGLDPSVRLKPSGVEWLGDVPEHWEVRQLKAVSTVQSGVTLGKQYVGKRLMEFPYLRVANVQDGHLNLSEVKTISIPEDEAARSLLQSGDVLMTEGGDPDKLGRGCVWEGQITSCLHQNHVFAVRPLRSQLRAHYLAALLASQYAKNYFLRTAKQTTNLASTNKTTIGGFPVLLPSTGEQDNILLVLERDLAQTGQAITNARREISLIREYRTRLIADVVTGKLDVREAAARLPEEPEPMDDTDILTEGEAADEDADLEATAEEVLA